MQTALCDWFVQYLREVIISTVKIWIFQKYRHFDGNNALRLSDEVGVYKLSRQSEQN